MNVFLHMLAPFFFYKGAFHFVTLILLRFLRPDMLLPALYRSFEEGIASGECNDGGRIARSSSEYSTIC
jgi:hypothetical protein